MHACIRNIDGEYQRRQTAVTMVEDDFCGVSDDCIIMHVAATQCASHTTRDSENDKIHASTFVLRLAAKAKCIIHPFLYWSGMCSYI